MISNELYDLHGESRGQPAMRYHDPHAVQQLEAGRVADGTIASQIVAKAIVRPVATTPAGLVPLALAVTRTRMHPRPPAPGRKREQSPQLAEYRRPNWGVVVCPSFLLAGRLKLLGGYVTVLGRPKPDGRHDPPVRLHIVSRFRSLVSGSRPLQYIVHARPPSTMQAGRSWLTCGPHDRRSQSHRRRSALCLCWPQRRDGRSVWCSYEPA